jgi:hypothetical protein
MYCKMFSHQQLVLRYGHILQISLTHSVHPAELHGLVEASPRHSGDPAGHELPSPSSTHCGHQRVPRNDIGHTQQL